MGSHFFLPVSSWNMPLVCIPYTQSQERRKEGVGKELQYKAETSDLRSAKRSEINALNQNIYASITKTVYLNKLLIVT